VIIQNLDNEASLGLDQFSFNITLQMEWQASMYFGPSRTAQGRNLSLTMVNTALARIS
jgi:hypothetical protein